MERVIKDGIYSKRQKIIYMMT
ncbi:hypothetical protein HKBW3S33_02100, partial [Candidatus Hakubella thermalkaliphila]